MKKKPPDVENLSIKIKNLKKNRSKFCLKNCFNNIKNVKNVVDDGNGNEDDGTNDESFWLNANENAKIQIWPYKKTTWKIVLSNIFTFLTLGFLRLLYYWKPEWQIRCMCVSCPVSEADCILIRDESFQYFLRYVRQAKTKSSTDDGGFTIMDDGGVAKKLESYRYFTHQKVLFVWNQRLSTYRRVSSFDDGVPVVKYHQCQPLTDAEAARRRAVYGPNEITVMLKPLIYLLFFEVLSPFYAFQAFSIMMWCLDYYYFYSAIIGIVSIATITIDVYQIRSNQRALKNAIVSSDVVTLVRDGQLPEVQPSTCVVPGDVIHIPSHGCILQCDAVLLTGTCIVNESMLTGESVPVTKTHLPYTSADNEMYDDKKYAKHTLYNGTRVLQTRYYSGQPVKAVVIRTGFNTMKGQLVRSIMYPKPVDFEFTKDLLRFVMLLAIIAVAGFIYSTVIMSVHDIDVGRIIIDSLNVICTVVPAALPAAMSIGIIVAKRRIERQEIYCISPSTINTCGAVNAVCFDKTGTLTEEGLDLLGVLPTEKNLFTGLVEHPANLGDDSEIVKSMACCHSLARIDGELVGDPLDLILFKETEWILEEPDVVEETSRFDLLAPTVVRPTEKSSVEIGILRQFTFSSSLQRMSVVVRMLGAQNLLLYCKGAPEMIASLCKSDSVPIDFVQVLHDYAKKGYRVLAVARRILDINFVKAQRAMREELELDMEFLGLVVLENRLKPETTPVITQLKDAALRTVMVTGDNILTAISVARECGILDNIRPLYIVEATSSPPAIKVQLEDGSAPNKINFGHNDKVTLFEWETEFGEQKRPKLTVKADYQLAIAGPSFAIIRKHFPHLLSQLVSACDVFARMGPEQKGQFVHCMQDLNYVVSMCGDGANDCGALKAAHVGISLSEAEASIASPFTSKRSNISCVPTLIREGRAALVTSFGVFKYMAAYSLNIFMTGCLLQWIGSDMADFQYLYIDLFLISVVAIFFGYTPASDILSPQRPPTKILSLPSVSSIFVQLFIFTSFQVFAFEFISLQPWFIPFVNPIDQTNNKSYQTTVVFFTSVFQYNIMAIIYSKSSPHRKTIFYNRFLFVWLFISTSVSIWFTVYPPNFIVEYLLLQMAPNVRYRVFGIFLGALNFLISCITEWYLVDWFLLKFVDENGHLKGSNPPKYISVLEEISRNIDWLNTAAASMTTVDEENETSSKRLPSPTLSDVSNNNIVTMTSAEDKSYKNLSGAQNVVE